MTYPASSPRGDDVSESSQRLNFIDRRRQRIADEIARNRRGEYTVPTWVLAATLLLIVGAWLALIFLA